MATFVDESHTPEEIGLIKEKIKPDDIKRIKKSPGEIYDDLCIHPSISEIIPRLYIGNVKSTYDEPTLQDNQISAVVSLVSGRHELWKQKKFTDYVTPDHHLWIGCLDSPSQNLLGYMDQICEFIDKTLFPSEGQTSPQSLEVDSDPDLPSGLANGVLVHCELGISRSPTVVIAYLMRKQRKGRDEVLAQVRKQRSVAEPSPNFMRQLEIWEEVEYQLWEDEKKEKPKKPYAAWLEREEQQLSKRGD